MCQVLYVFSSNLNDKYIKNILDKHKMLERHFLMVLHNDDIFTDQNIH
jgi:hypothetical protein